MAMSATISVSPSTAVISQTINGAVVISNSGGSDVNLVFCQPKTKRTSSPSYEINTMASTSQPVPLQGHSVVVPAGGSVTVPISYIFNSPSTNQLGSGYGIGTYDCSATLQTSDGSVFEASPAATCTISPLVLPSNQLG